MQKVKDFLKKAVIDLKTRKVLGQTGDSSPIGEGKPATPKHDPFSWSDVSKKTGLNELQIRGKTGKPINVHTSSDLLAHDDYAQHLPKNSTVNFYSHGPMPKNGFPSETRLKRAGQKLSGMGHKVNYHDFTPEEPKVPIKIPNVRAIGLVKSETTSPHKQMLACLNKCKSMMQNMKDPLVKGGMASAASSIKSSFGGGDNSAPTPSIGGMIGNAASAVGSALGIGAPSLGQNITAGLETMRPK